MGFWGSSFVFDNIHCSEYGLMVYDFGSTTQGDTSFQSGEVVEDRIPRRPDSLMYGLTQNQALEYTLVFGANMESVDRNVSLDRYDIDAIATWLTGHQSRRYLEIIQDDMDPFRYKCTITNLKLITYGQMPWAFSCTVHCDSPFGYYFPDEFSYSVSGSTMVNLYNKSGYNGFYYPNMELTIKNGNSISIQNITDNGRVFSFSDLPGGRPLMIYIDNKNQVITCGDDLNLYPYFNYKFLRLIRGENMLNITGDADVKLICEFPANIGG